MQIGQHSSPLALTVLKTLGSPVAAASVNAASVSGAVANPASANPLSSGSATDRNEPAGPPEAGRIPPRGSFVDLKA